MEYWLVSFWGVLWALFILKIIMSSATSGMLVCPKTLVCRMFSKINVFLSPLFLILSLLFRSLGLIFSLNCQKLIMCWSGQAATWI